MAKKIKTIVKVNIQGGAARLPARIAMQSIAGGHLPAMVEKQCLGGIK